jgi:hypothetical protein
VLKPHQGECALQATIVTETVNVKAAKSPMERPTAPADMYVSFSRASLHTIRSKQTLFNQSSEISGVLSGGLLAHGIDTVSSDL